VGSFPIHDAKTYIFMHKSIFKNEEVNEYSPNIFISKVIEPKSDLVEIAKLIVVKKKCKKLKLCNLDKGVKEFKVKLKESEGLALVDGELLDSVCLALAN
jgi:hypothetical protein